MEESILVVANRAHRKGKVGVVGNDAALALDLGLGAWPPRKACLGVIPPGRGEAAGLNCSTLRP